VAGDFSWEAESDLLSWGVDGWIDPKFNNANPPAPDVNYTYQSLAVNMRGFPLKCCKRQQCFGCKQ
jgi:hypothetical protein